jgi:hypothetical protein
MCQLTHGSEHPNGHSLAFVGRAARSRRCACSAMARGIGAAPAPARQSSVTTDVVYGHKDGLALTFDVHGPAQPNGAGLIWIVSGGWQSSVEMGRLIAVNGSLAARRGRRPTPRCVRASSDARRSNARSARPAAASSCCIRDRCFSATGAGPVAHTLQSSPPGMTRACCRRVQARSSRSQRPGSGLDSPPTGLRRWSSHAIRD